MSRERNVELVQAGVEAFNRGDEDAVVGVFAPDLECHVGGGLMNVGTWYGHEGYREMITSWGEAWERNRNTLVSVESPDDDHVIAEIHQTAIGAGSGVPVEMTVFYMLEVRDGQAVRFHLYADREAARRAVTRS